MSEVPSASAALPFWRRSLVLIPAFGVLAALAVGLRIVERGEIWLDRTFWLTGIAAFGGFAGAALTRASWRLLTTRLLSWRATRSWPRLVSAILFTTLFMMAMIVANVAHFLVIADQIDMREDLPLRAWFWVANQVTALFLISCPAYLLPWPLPVLMLAAGWLLPPHGREAPDKNTRNS